MYKFDLLKAKIRLKSSLSCLLFKNSIKKIDNLPSSKIFIITYHRVFPKERIDESVEPGMYITPATFRMHLQFLKRHFHLLDISYLSNKNINLSERINKPVCIVTFDDGWLDFYEYAWSIIEEEQVPTVVFLPTNLIDKNETFWTDKLAFILKNNGFDCLYSELSNYIEISIHQRPKKFEQFIVLLKKLKFTQIDQLLNICLCKMNLSDSLKRSFMNWNEIHTLYKTGFVSFGSHTDNHAILTALSEPEIVEELMSSKQKLIDNNVVEDDVHFCYPNGNFNEDIARIVKEVGYASAVTTISGYNNQGSDPFTLKRVSLHEDISSTIPMLAYQLARHF